MLMPADVQPSRQLQDRSLSPSYVDVRLFLARSFASCKQRHMHIVSGALYGEGASGELRRAAALQERRTLAILAQLDGLAADQPLHRAWLRLEHRAGLVNAARMTGHELDLQTLLAFEMGGRQATTLLSVPATLHERDRRWWQAAQRKGPTELRLLVARLAPARRGTLLVDLADAIRRASGDVRAFAARPRTERGGPGADTSEADLGDLAMALPFALRRMGLSRVVVPSLSSGAGLLRRRPDDEDETGAAWRERLLMTYAQWLRSLERDAGQAASRLRLLDEQAAAGMRRIAGLRRPAAMQRLLAMSLARPCLWATRLARATNTDVSSAWRLLVQAEELALVVRVPLARRSRGDGVLFASPVYLKLAGLVSVKPTPGRPPTISRSTPCAGGLAAAMADLDSLLDELDDRAPPGAG